MIATEFKPIEEIMEALEGSQKIYVMGCGGCANVCKTGGDEAVRNIAGELTARGKEVSQQGVPERTCYIDKTQKFLEDSDTWKHFDEADAILVLACGGAVQIVRRVSEERGLVKPIYAGLNTMFHADTIKAGFLVEEECSDCGDCMLNYTGGICPVTRCAKGLLNGPCGGAENGRCESDSFRDCAWIQILERMEKLGQVDRIKKYIPAKNYARHSKPMIMRIGENACIALPE